MSEPTEKDWKDASDAFFEMEAESRGYVRISDLEHRVITQFQLDPRGKIIALTSDGALWIKDEGWRMITPIPNT